MFTWICPQCGREVPPAYNDCPDCAGKTSAPGHAAAAPAPQAPHARAPEGDAPHPPPQVAAPPRKAPVAPLPSHNIHGHHLPPWFLSIVFFLAFIGVAAIVYQGVTWMRARNQAAASAAVALENPTAKTNAKTNPLQKFIEISGIRFSEDDKKRIVAKFVVTNHSEAEIGGLAGNVTIWGRTQKSEEDSEGTFTFKTVLGPYESKELTEPINTKLKIYELPDWQNATADLQVTAP